MSKILDITVIIPVHKLEEKEIELLNEAKNSVYANSEFAPSNVVIVCTPEVEKEIKLIKAEDSRTKIEIVVNTDKSDFASQVNKIAKDVKTKYFSILEFDDKYHKIYFKHVSKYIDLFPEVSVFLPMVAEVNLTDQLLKYSNEAVFNIETSNQLQTPMGELSFSVLNQIPNFIISGGIFKTEDYNEIGGLKPSIKITYIYEYLLRITNHDQKVLVIPKIGYIHRNGRETSITTQYMRENMSQEEIKFWFDLAKKELYFKKDRNITYTPKKVENVTI